MKHSKHSPFANKALALAAERFNALPLEQKRAMQPALENYLEITGLSKRADASELHAAMRRAVRGNDPSKSPEPSMMPLPWLMPAYSESESHRYMPPMTMPAEATQPEARELEPEAPDTTAQPEVTQTETRSAEKQEAKLMVPWRFTFGRDFEGRIARVSIVHSDGTTASFGIKRGHDSRITDLVRED